MERHTLWDLNNTTLHSLSSMKYFHREDSAVLSCPEDQGLAERTPEPDLLDFFLGEQSHSFQLLELRDPLLNSLLNDFRHGLHGGVTNSHTYMITFALECNTDARSSMDTCEEVVIGDASGSVRKYVRRGKLKW